MKFSIYVSVIASLAMFGCSVSESDPNGFNVFTLDYNFNTSVDGWSANFADYKVADSAKSSFVVETVKLPANIALDQQSIKVAGINLGDNLFMFLKKKVTGLKPNSDYTLVFEVEFASNAPMGKAQGDSVFLKVGASTGEPNVVLENGYYRLNISKGVGYNNGADAVVIGNISTTANAPNYSIIQKSNSSSAPNPYYLAHTDVNGELWLIIGTDSTFKGLSTVYYTSVSVVLSVSK